MQETHFTDYILFHHFKHHLNHLAAWIAANKGNVDAETILTVKTLGSSQLDMYHGNLNVEQIKQQAADFLQSQGIKNNEEYRLWVGKGHKLFTLSDGSSFTMRYIEHDKPVHIHPGRHASHTVRIKANALKSAVCYLLISDDVNINIEQLNNIRKQHLSLSPIARKQDIAEIIKAIRLLSKQLQESRC